MQTQQRPICIIGAGLIGTSLAIELSKIGYDVEVYDQRPNPLGEEYTNNLLSPLLLYERGMEGLRRLGLLSEVKRISCYIDGMYDNDN